MDALSIYKPENNTYFGPNKPCQSIVLESKDFGRGCIILIERNTFGYKLKPKAGYKIGRTLVIEVWEYNTEGYPECLYHLDLKTRSKRLGKRMLNEACWDGAGIGLFPSIG